MTQDDLLLTFDNLGGELEEIKDELIEIFLTKIFLSVGDLLVGN